MDVTLFEDTIFPPLEFTTTHDVLALPFPSPPFLIQTLEDVSEVPSSPNTTLLQYQQRHKQYGLVLDVFL